MGLIRDVLTKGARELSLFKGDLVKAGVLTPDKGAYDQKASLVDPMSYHSHALGYKERFSLLDYSKCRQLTYADPVIAAILQLRINQVAASCMPQPDKYKLGYKVRLRDHEKTPSKADKSKSKEIEQFILACGVPENFDDTPERKRRDNFETFLRKISRDALTFDQINFEITPRKNGMPYSFQAVDASTIRMIPDQKEMSEAYGGHKGANSQEEFAGRMAWKTEFDDFKPKHPRFAQVVNGQVRHVFDEWEMAFGVRNPRTDILSFGYGFSEIEMLVTTITAHMNAETYNRRFFSQGATVKGILTFEGVVPPDQLEAFRRQWYQQVSGVQNAWKTPIMSLGKDSKLNWQTLHSTNREMEYGKWMEYCIKTICGVFQVDPIEIGFDISSKSSGDGGGGGLGDANQSERISYSKDRGLRPLLRHIQSLMNEYLVYRIDPDFEFEFVGLNVKSEKDDLDHTISKVKNYMTVNEIRAEHDLPNIKKLEDIDNPLDLPLDNTLLQTWSQLRQAAQQAEMGGEEGMGDEMGGMDEGGDVMNPASGGAVPGEDDGGEGEDEMDYENMSLEELQAELDKMEGSDDDKK